MSNRSGISSDLATLLSENNQIIFTAVKAEFDTETLYVWSGTENMSIDGQEYIGAGDLLNISEVTDNLDMRSNNISITLAGMDATVLNLALNENYQNRFITIFLGLLSGGTDIVAGKMILFKGRMTSMTINDDPNGSTIGLEAENRLIDLSKPSNLRYTNQSQRYINSSDTCFSRVATLADKEITWGKSTTGGGAGGAGGGRGGGGTKRHISQK